MFVGIQVYGHNFFDQGIGSALDYMREAGDVNAVMPMVYSYYGAKNRPAELLARHGDYEPRTERGRNLPSLWIKPDSAVYKGGLQHASRPKDQEYADRDLLAELIPEAKKRSIQVVPRILGGGAREALERIPGWSVTLATDAYGRPALQPCPNSPEFRQWLTASVEDMVRRYEIDGIQYGAERSGPLPELLLGRGEPVCFCERCRDIAARKGIDGEQAAAGFRELDRRLREWREEDPFDGYFVSVLRILLAYPAMMAWEGFYNDSIESLTPVVYGLVKRMKSSLHVGAHVLHRSAIFDFFYRAETDYATIADSCDWIKPLVYHDVAGPRIRDLFVKSMEHSLFGDFPERFRLEFFYYIMGFDPKREPGLEEMDRGMSEEFVYREVSRAVHGAGGRVPVYAGIGMDIPYGQSSLDGSEQAWPTTRDREKLYRATKRAFDAGAGGIVHSREYDEIREESLLAVRRAIREQE